VAQCIYLCFFKLSLFSKSDYIASNEGVMNNELEITSKKAVVV
jgi:hypothetical protein